MDGPQTQCFSFGEFEVDASSRRLRRGGKSLPLNAKAFDLLLFLAGNAGRVISKDQILGAVWQDRFVEEANLAVQISALRRVLGDRADDPRFIVTIPGQGYEFIGKVDNGGELLITDHTISRVMVEETITSDAGPRGRSGSSGVLSWRRVLIGLAIVAILFTGFWFYRGQRGFGAAVPVDATNRRSSKRIFPTSGGIPHFATISPDGKDLAYVINQRGQVAIRVGQVDTGDSIQISPYADRVYKCIRFAPDGKSIYATIRDANHPFYTLVRMSVLGGAQIELLQTVDSQVTFSPDGKDFAFIRQDPANDRNTIVIADAQTGKNERILLTREGKEKMYANGISWSPDGTMIAFAAADGLGRGSALLTVNVNDGSIGKICQVGNLIVNLAWLHDQSGLILNRGTGGGANDGQLWQVTYPGGELSNLSNDTLSYSGISLSVSADNKVVVVPSHSDTEIWTAPAMDLAHARRLLAGSWARREGMAGLFAAPDGKILFVAKSGTSGKSIWEMDASGEDQRQLTVPEKDSSDEQVAVTADDRYIVFQSDRSGSPQIWRANRDGSDMKPLTSDGDNQEPTLTPDGSYVIFSRYANGGSSLWRVPISGGEATQLVAEQSSWAAMSPDGRYIACEYGKDADHARKGVAIIPAEGGSPVHFFPVPPRAALYNRLTWSPDGASIIYKDETQGLWKQDLVKDKPEQIIGIEDFRFYHMASAGADLIYSGGVIKRDIEIIEGL